MFKQNIHDSDADSDTLLDFLNKTADENDPTTRAIKVRCCWGDCGQTFETFNSWESYKLFESHVEQHGLSTFTNIEEEGESYHGLVCSWLNCTWELMLPKTEDIIYLAKKHMCEHAFHSRLIAIGEFYAKEHNLPPCTCPDKFLPEFHTVLKCEWLHCPYNTHPHISPVAFFSHVLTHAAWSSDAQNSENKKFCCCWGECRQTFKSTKKLKAHLRGHSWEKRIACYSCGGCFVSSTKLRHHLFRQIRDEDGAFACRYCPKKFLDENFLNEHIQSHGTFGLTKERPFSCDLCDFTCGMKSNLKRHYMFKHSDARDYKCDVCQKTSIYSY